MNLMNLPRVNQSDLSPKQAKVMSEAQQNRLRSLAWTTKL